MTSPQKCKGNGWEREVCMIMQQHFGGNWQRVPNSGAFTGGNNAHRRQQLTATQTRLFKGDIIVDDAMPRMVIECKFYADLPWHQLFSGACAQVDAWLLQTQISADAHDIYWLCMKFNRKGRFMMFRRELLEHFHVTNYMVYGDHVMTDMLTFLQANAMAMQKLHV